MSSDARTGYALLPDPDDTPPDRAKGDDLATRREEEFLQAALRDQARRAERQRGTPGICSNCGEMCMPLAVYCDEDCRDDHEWRLRRERAR